MAHRIRRHGLPDRGAEHAAVACFGVLVAPLSARFGWSRGQIGAAVSFMAVAIMLCSPWQGALIDRFGARRVVLCSIPAFAVGLVAMRWLPPSLPLFYAAWFALPLMAAGLWPASYLKAVSGWFDRRLGAATGLANAGIGLGTILLPPAINAAAVRYGVGGAFTAMGILALLALPIAAAVLRENDLPAPLAGRRAAGRWSYPATAADPRCRRVFGSFLLLGVTGTGLIANLVPIMTAKGLSVRTALLGLAGYGTTALVGRVATGALLDRLQVTTVMWLLAASTAASLALLAMGGPAWSAVGEVAVLGLLSGGEFNVLACTIRRFFGLEAFGRIYGLAFSMFQLGGAIGAALLAASVGWLSRYDAGLVLMAAVALASARLFAGIGRHPRGGEALSSATKGPRTR